MLFSLLLAFLINAASLWVVTLIIPGITIANWQTLAVAAIVVGLVNALIRPIVQLIALPISIITFGIFAIIINGLMLLLAANFVSGFTVSGFWPAVIGALVLSLVSAVLSSLMKAK